MQTRRVYKQGNSTVITIPSYMLHALKIKPGDQVALRLSRTSSHILITKHTPPKWD